MAELAEAELKRLRMLMRKHGLADHQDLLLREAQPAISLFVDEIVERRKRRPMAAYPLGTSRFGGVPDLPEGCEWPTARGEPLCFILQLALASLPVVPESPLPARGMLWVFQSAAEIAGGLTLRMLWRNCAPSGTRVRRA